MITFRRIRRRDFLYFFVSILRVMNFCMHDFREKRQNIACLVLAETFIFKIRMSQKGTSA
jgi:hypothetical protein